MIVMKTENLILQVRLLVGQVLKINITSIWKGKMELG